MRDEEEDAEGDGGGDGVLEQRIPVAGEEQGRTAITAETIRILFGMTRCSRSVSVIAASVEARQAAERDLDPVVGVAEQDADEDRRQSGLEQRVGRRDLGVAVAAAPAQSQVREQRNVVVGGDLRPAARASRTRRDDRLAQRNAVGDDAEEAADDQAEHGHEDDLRRPPVRFLRRRAGSC